ncbi:hypothetical protein, partial [Prevotella sp. MGM1]|uniref:hypothetical protein n=1 Tax=Prevotella sp. MGM1 TaxID=2033405 RepID=UPI001E3547B1
PHYTLDTLSRPPEKSADPCFAVVFPMFGCWMPAVALSCYWIIFVYRYFDLGVGNDVGVDNKKKLRFPYGNRSQ